MKLLQFIILLGLAAITGNAQAKQTDNLPGLPAQSDEHFLDQREKNNPSGAKSSSQPTEHFFTGKPYDSELGGFIFKYRNYDPELNRWTSIDPTGFPDTLNGYQYVISPIFQFDPLGLETKTVKITASWLQTRTQHTANNGQALPVPLTVNTNRSVDFYINYTVNDPGDPPTISVSNSYTFGNWIQDLLSIDFQYSGLAFGVGTTVSHSWKAGIEPGTGKLYADITWSVREGGFIGVDYDVEGVNLPVRWDMSEVVDSGVARVYE